MPGPAVRLSTAINSFMSHDIFGKPSIGTRSQSDM
jgi:hypothetical protein